MDDSLLRLLASINDRRISRRSFLKATGTTIAATWAFGIRAEERAARAVRLNDPLQPLSFRVTRARDLLTLDLEFINFQPVMRLDEALFPSGKKMGLRQGTRWRRPMLHIASYARQGYVSIRLGGQHVAEQAIWDRSIQENQKEKREDRKRETFLFDDEDSAFLKKPRSNTDSEEYRVQPWLTGLAGAWMAGDSRLVFMVPQDKTPIALDVDEILRRCAEEFDLVVYDEVVGAEAEGPASHSHANSRAIRLQDPVAGHHDTVVLPTRIEFPSLLYLSPYDNARWKLRPRSYGGRHELWGIELRQDANAAPVYGRPRDVRQAGHLFPVGFEADAKGEPVDGLWDLLHGVPTKGGKYTADDRPKVSLYAATRKLLVEQAAKDNGDVRSRLFRLTPLGASVELFYSPLVIPSPGARDWNLQKSEGTEPQKDNEQDEAFLTEWIQKSEIGRDYYVKESFAGWWMPFGLRGEVVTITERLFCHSKTKRNQLLRILTKRPELMVREEQGSLTALLVARKFGVVRDLFKEYGGSERDDFDEVGGILSRAAGLYRVDILTDRTPTLSNQHQVATNYIEAITKGRDVVFVAGSDTSLAGSEVFWPRVATRTADGSPALAPYKFPVKLTFHDREEQFTSAPMLFSYSLKLGNELYGAAPEVMRRFAVGTKVTLAPPQNSAAVNPNEMSGKDVLKLSKIVRDAEQFPGDISLHKHAVVIPEEPRIDPSPLNNVVLATAISSVLGGVREIVLKASADIDEAQIDEYDNKVDEVEKHYENGFVVNTARSIAWGPDSHHGVTAALALERITEYFRSRHFDEASARKFGQCINDDVITKLSEGARKKWRESKLGEKYEKAIKAALSFGQEPDSAIHREALDLSLRDLQIESVNVLGREWVRAHWDKAFLLIATKERRRQVARSCLRSKKVIKVIRGGLPKVEPPKDERPNDQVSSGDLGWITPEKAFFSPKLQETIKTLLSGVIGLGQDADEQEVLGINSDHVLRLYDAVRLAFPNDTWFAKRLRWVAEDLGNFKELDYKQLKHVKDEAKKLCDELALHIAHIAQYVDDGAAIASRFVRDVAGDVAFLAKEVAHVASEIEKVVPKIDISLSGKVSDFDDRFLEHALQQPPAKTLAELENILYETGDRFVKESVESLSGLLRDAEGMLTSSNKLFETLSQITVAGLVRDRMLLGGYRRECDRLDHDLNRRFEAAANALDVVREFLREILDKRFEKILAAEIADSGLPGLRPGPRGKVSERNIVTLITESVPARLAIKLRDLLRELASLEGIPETARKEVVEVEAQITQQIVALWAVGEKVIEAAEKKLEVYGAYLGRDFIARTKRILDAAGKSAERRLIADRLEWIVLVLGTHPDKDKALERIFGALLVEEAKEKAEKVTESWKKAWNDKVAPRLEEIQKKYGDGIPSTDELEKRLGKSLVEDILKDVNDVLDPVAKALDTRGKALRGRAQNMVRKAGLALQCPSMLKSFQDQAVKSSYYVEHLVFSTVSKATEVADGLAHDLRSLEGLAKLETLKVKIPGVETLQEIAHTQEYVKSGLRHFEAKVSREVNSLRTGVFAALKRPGDLVSALPDAGMVKLAPKINEFSRELGAIETTARKQLGELKDRAKDGFDKAEEKLKKEIDAHKSVLETAIKDLKLDLGAERDALLKSINAYQIETLADLNKKLDQLKGRVKKGVADQIEELKESLAPQIREIELAVEGVVSDVKSLLPADMPKLFNKLDLNEVLKVIGNPDKAPELLAKEYPDRVQRTYRWSNGLQDYDLGGILKFVPEPPGLGDTDPNCSRLNLTSDTTIWLPKPNRQAKKPEVSVRGQLGPFSLDVLGMIKIYFQSLSLTTINGKTDFTPRLGRVAGSGSTGSDDFIEFQGPLQFVDKIRDALSSLLGGSDGPRINVLSERVTAGYELALPSLGFGVVAITDIRLLMDVGLPLKQGALTYDFKLSERLQPFRVSVSGFAGGGYFGLRVSPDRSLCYVEGSLEFGGSLDFSFGSIAEGALYLMGGAYFRWSRSAVVFEGYIRAGGRISVLGLIKVSVCFYLALRYQRQGKQTSLTGVCVITIQIKMCFFKKTVHVEMERTFAGSKPRDDNQVAWTHPRGLGIGGEEHLYAGGRAGSAWATDAWEIVEAPTRFDRLYPTETAWASHRRNHNTMYAS